MSIRDLKVKINSIQNIQKITKAMKMVAAARLKRAQENLEAARPYAQKVAEVALDLASLTTWSFNPFLRPHHQAKKILILVFTGDQSLAGGFHQKVADGALRFGRKFDQAEVAYYVFGVKGMQRLQHYHVKVHKKYDGPVAKINATTISDVAKELVDLYLSGEYDQVYLYYAKFISAMQQRTRAFQLLPIDPSKSRTKETHGQFIFEPEQQQLLDGIIPRYIESEISRGFMETETGELGSRMTAMSSATDNAGELIDRYRLEYNRARQGQITTEIAEIIGGSEALKEE